MADKEKLTDDMDLPPGVVVTPGHVVQEPNPTAIASDKKLDPQGNVVEPGEFEFGSTYDKGGAAGAAKAAPETKVSKAEDKA